MLSTTPAPQQLSPVERELAKLEAAFKSLSNSYWFSDPDSALEEEKAVKNQLRRLKTILNS